MVINLYPYGPRSVPLWLYPYGSCTLMTGYRSERPITIYLLYSEGVDMPGVFSDLAPV